MMDTRIEAHGGRQLGIDVLVTKPRIRIPQTVRAYATRMCRGEDWVWHDHAWVVEIKLDDLGSHVECSWGEGERDEIPPTLQDWVDRICSAWDQAIAPKIPTVNESISDPAFFAMELERLKLWLHGKDSVLPLTAARFIVGNRKSIAGTSKYIASLLEAVGWERRYLPGRRWSSGLAGSYRWCRPGFQPVGSRPMGAVCPA